MKCAKLGRLCSMTAVVVLLAAALLPEVCTNAAPRGADEAVRGTGKSGTEVTRLVTGDWAQINTVIAGSPPTAILAINPVPVPAGVTPPNPYPPGTVIIGNELRAEVGGFRAWFNVQVSNWDDDGDGSPTAESYQVKIDCTNYKGVNAVPPNPGVDLAPAVVACSSNGTCSGGTCSGGSCDGQSCAITADCHATCSCKKVFGESFAKCGRNPGLCDAGYVHVTGVDRSDSWCATYEECNAGGVAIQTCNYNYFAVSASVTGTVDGGIVYYGGTLVLDIPAGAKGKYTVHLDTENTFILEPLYGGEVYYEIPTLAETGFVVNIVTGQCCYGLGTLDEGCIDGVLRSECGDDEPGPFKFALFDQCSPDGPDCSRYLGACCDTFNGSCQNSVLQADCQGLHRRWTSGTSCDGASCIADTGACCDHDPFGPCADDIVLSDCRCATCTWHKLQACPEIECAPTSIPTVSEWGLAVLTLLLLTGAKIYFGRSPVTRESSDTR